MIKGRLDRRASTATGYAWLVLVWEKDKNGGTALVWIPPCRKAPERHDDYATSYQPFAKRKLPVGRSVW
jgi:hypothetical protein